MAQIQGKVKLTKISNNTSRNVLFKNPNNGKEGSIGAGQSNEGDCVGLIPSWSYPNRYEITYYNAQLGKRVLVKIKDVHEFIAPNAISFWNHDGCKPETEHIACIHSQSPNFHIVFDGNGYLIYNGDTNKCVSACRFWP